MLQVLWHKAVYTLHNPWFLINWHDLWPYPPSEHSMRNKREKWRITSIMLKIKTLQMISRSTLTDKLVGKIILNGKFFWSKKFWPANLSVKRILCGNYIKIYLLVPRNLPWLYFCSCLGDHVCIPNDHKLPMAWWTKILLNISTCLFQLVNVLNL